MTCTCGDCEPEISRRSFLAKAGLAASSMALSLLHSSDVSALARPGINVAKGLDIYPRSEWGSKLPAKPGLKPEKSVLFLLLHHTAASNTYKQNQVAQQIQSIYQFHTGSQKKWPDVCYNFFVDRFGGVWEGRSGSLAGPVEADATGGSQGFAQLVCLLGNFETARPPQVMIDSCGKVLGWLAHRYNIDVDQTKTLQFVSRGSNKWKAGSKVVARPISGHRDMSATACPGKFVYPRLEVEIPTLAATFKKEITRSNT
jgi:hypothetical protein